jgi:mevalonate kinase
MKSPLFYAKILLFGEYGIIKDSKGLAIPYSSYKGSLLKSGNNTPEQTKSNEHLRKFYFHLKTINPSLVSFDWETFEKDLQEGMYFDSSIPQGYGVGSSGALVAAVYDKYALVRITILENLTRDKLLRLKAIFVAMESFFHGKSSGLDPLNSYLSLPILIHSKTDLEATGIPSQKEGKGAVFLIDSEQVGETAPMVEIFMENLKNEGFRKMVKEEFARYTDASIQDFLKGDVSSLFQNVQKLSQVVLNHFKPMIPQKIQGVWQRGLDTGDYYLKLCGSGGGGYFLGFTEDFEKTKNLLNQYKLELVYRF